MPTPSHKETPGRSPLKSRDLVPAKNLYVEESHKQELNFNYDPDMDRLMTAEELRVQHRE